MPRNQDDSVIVGTARLAKITGKSTTWAKYKLKEWLAEQERGGPQRVFVSGKQHALRTTLAVVQRELLGGIHDPVLMRKVQEHDRDLDALARRIDKLTTEVCVLRSQVSRSMPLTTPSKIRTS